MDDRFDTLIAKIKIRAFDPKRNTDLGTDFFHFQTGEPSFPTLPPVTSGQIEEAEAQLGFELPDLLRRLYLQVGNGQWGPGYGLPPLVKTPQSSEHLVLAELIELDHKNDEPGKEWPLTLIPLCHKGCGRSLYIERARPDLPVIFVNPEFFCYINFKYVESVQELLAYPRKVQQYWAFDLVSDSLEAYLWKWANNVIE